MPAAVTNVIPFFRDLSFDDVAARALGDAYDKACRSLHNCGQPALIEEIIASTIIKCASNGERDPDALCDQALRTLGLSRDLR